MRKLKLLIVGAGPVGLTLAKELHYFGLTPRLIDQNLAPCHESRALALWSRTLEHLALRHEIDPFLAAGLKMKGLRTYADQTELFKIDFSHLATPYPFALILPQSQTESILLKQLEERGGTVERGVSLRSYQQGEEGVLAVLHHHDTKEDETVCVDYLLGCDGAKSTVRHGMNVHFSGETEDETWVLGDLTLKSTPPLDRTHLTVCWNKKGALALFPLPNGEVRLVTSRGQFDDRPVTVEELQAYLKERAPFSFDITAHSWLSSFKINERITDRYYEDRVILLGDAAHIHSPAGGQGMNTGMQDAMNLAWKLAEIEQGRDASALLASYALERRHVGKQVVDRAAKMTHWVSLKNRLLIRLRNVVFPHLSKMPKIVKALTATMAEINIFYQHTPLIIKPKDHPGYPGTRMLNASLDETTLFERAHCNTHSLLIFGEDQSARKMLIDLFPNSLNVIDIPPKHASLFKLYNISVPTWVLVRPDHYIAARGALRDPHSLKLYIKELLGS